MRIDQWFNEPGAYVLVDGQFGSTGKGLLAGYIAERSGGRITHVTTNAGPNSGHTAYYLHAGFDDQVDYEKIVTQQVPVASVFLAKMGQEATTLINAGAIIDSEILAREVKQWLDHHHVLVHPCAALINDIARSTDAANVASVSGTGKGVGPAMQNKIGRTSNAVARSTYYPMYPTLRPPTLDWDRFWDWSEDVVFVETAQGFSLGINSAKFYPFVTSRECTVMQALADARIPASRLRKVVMCLRTYPIRVGSVEGTTSGDCYPDQREMTWEEVGQPAELTTVTKRQRRIFSWSSRQFKEAVAANEPNVLFLNFCNYLDSLKLIALIQEMRTDYFNVLGRMPEQILLGFGDKSENIIDVDEWFENLMDTGGDISG